MIADLDRYHGAVLRQLLVKCDRAVTMSLADLSGRKDAFSIEHSAFQIKHSRKRLSPWQFTYMPEHFAELNALEQSFNPVWSFLVCGEDGIVGLSSEELRSVAELGDGGAAWLRVTRSRNGMYHVSGALGELSRAKPKGVQEFIDELSVKL